ncbi:hypothetical protein ACS0TY_023099 [Phlomoides rotata]
MPRSSIEPIEEVACKEDNVPEIEDETRRLAVVNLDWSQVRICNILRKKHNEAKEILARAIVNSNKLLMLNNHRFQENISFMLSTYIRVKERSKTTNSITTRSTCSLDDERDEIITVASGTLSPCSSTGSLSHLDANEVDQECGPENLNPTEHEYSFRHMQHPSEFGRIM